MPRAGHHFHTEGKLSCVRWDPGHASLLAYCGVTRWGPAAFARAGSGWTAHPPLAPGSAPRPSASAPPPRAAAAPPPPHAPPRLPAGRRCSCTTRRASRSCSCCSRPPPRAPPAVAQASPIASSRAPRPTAWPPPATRGRCTCGTRAPRARPGWRSTRRAAAASARCRCRPTGGASTGRAAPGTRWAPRCRGARARRAAPVARPAPPCCPLGNLLPAAALRSRGLVVLALQRCCFWQGRCRPPFLPSPAPASCTCGTCARRAPPARRSCTLAARALGSRRCCSSSTWGPSCGRRWRTRCCASPARPRAQRARGPAPRPAWRGPWWCCRGTW
jgi:hypothetical protein